MKLGKETGSLVNHIMSRATDQPAPQVGMGATILMWSDRHAATIVKVTKTQVHVKQDKAVRIDTNGMSEHQEYTYTSDPDASVEVFRMTKRGYRSSSGAGLVIGERDEYYDPSF